MGAREERGEVVGVWAGTRGVWAGLEGALGRRVRRLRSPPFRSPKRWEATCAMFLWNTQVVLSIQCLPHVKPQFSILLSGENLCISSFLHIRDF